MKVKVFAACLLALSLTAPLLAQGGRGKAEVTINGKAISIDYGRPNWGGQDRLAAAPVGTVWRLGMNLATHIETSGDLKVGSTTLKAGKYTLWAKRTGADTWALLFHPKTGAWGAPSPSDGFVAETPLKVSKAGAAVEQLTISLSDNKGKAGIKIEWGNAVLSGELGVL